MEHSKTCLFCGTSFQSLRSDAKFCSANCRTKFSKAKKRGRVPAPAPAPGQVVNLERKTFFPGQKYSDATDLEGLFSEVLLRVSELNDRLKGQEEVYLLPVQACELLSISKSTFDRYVRDGILKTYFLRGLESKTKKKLYVKKSDVLDLFQEGQ